ncbi:MAG: FCD domain-containing protein [Paracoccaceae bacterium]
MSHEDILTDSSNLVLGRLRRLLTDGQIGTDGRLPTERQLSERLNVGRRDLRRALEVLEAEGLLWRRQGKGTFVGLPPDPTGVLAAKIAGETQVSDILEARRCIEPVLAGLCALRATPEHVARMRTIAERIRTARDPDGVELWDGALHRLIAQTADNRILLTAFALVDEIRNSPRWRAWRQRARTTDSHDVYGRHHAAIIDRIAAGDAAGAEAAMRSHLELLAERIRIVLENQAASDD